MDFLSKGCFFKNLFSEILICIVDLLWPTLSKKKSVSLNFYKSSLCLSIYPIVFFNLCFNNVLVAINYLYCFLRVVNIVGFCVKPLFFNIIILWQGIQQFYFYTFIFFLLSYSLWHHQTYKKQQFFEFFCRSKTQQVIIQNPKNFRFATQSQKSSIFTWSLKLKCCMSTLKNFLSEKFSLFYVPPIISITCLLCLHHSYLDFFLE